MPSTAEPAGGTAPGWPPAVRAELARRRERITGAIGSGVRVLDLADPAALASVLGAGDAAAGRYDAVMSVGALARVADLPGALVGIAGVLAPTGRFLFVEPVGRAGWAAVLAASAGSLLGSLRGLHLNRDLPAAIRAAGFVITDLERFTMPTPVWPARWFVDGSARLRSGFPQP